MGYEPLSASQRRRIARRGIILASSLLLGLLILLAVLAPIMQHLVNSENGAAPLPSQVTKTAPLGSPITLTGLSAGEQVTVTAVRIINSATPVPSESFLGPPSGQRLYAVEFRLDNTGTIAYDENAGVEATVIDTSGKSYTDALVDAVGCQEFGDPHDIAPGTSQTACVTFDVPATATIREITYIPDGGQDTRTGEWPLSS